jgi:broad specificity phosphatase PhoE
MALRRRSLHLVRHAESNWNVMTAGEHVGAHPNLVDVDSDLSPKGERQLDALRNGPALAPPLELILASPLRRALRTALALQTANGGETVPMHVEPRATEWLENSCDCGRPGPIIQREFGTIRGLETLGDGWWPALSNEHGVQSRSTRGTLAALATGGREAAASVDRRCSQLVHKLLHELTENSVAVVAHCMVLHRLESMLREQCGGDELIVDQDSSGVSHKVEYLDNTQVRSFTVNVPGTR